MFLRPLSLGAAHAASVPCPVDAAVTSVRLSPMYGLDPQTDLTPLVGCTLDYVRIGQY